MATRTHLKQLLTQANPPMVSTGLLSSDISKILQSDRPIYHDAYGANRKVSYH